MFDLIPWWFWTLGAAVLAWAYWKDIKPRLQRAWRWWQSQELGITRRPHEREEDDGAPYGVRRRINAGVPPASYTSAGTELSFRRHHDVVRLEMQRWRAMGGALYYRGREAPQWAYDMLDVAPLTDTRIDTVERLLRAWHARER